MQLHVRLVGSFESALVNQKGYDAISGASTNVTQNKNSDASVEVALVKKGQDPQSSDWKLLNESDIIRQATEEAAKIKQEAMDMRAHVEYDLKCKIDEVLSDSEVTLRDALTLIRNNREELRKTDGNANTQYQGNASETR